MSDKKTSEPWDGLRGRRREDAMRCEIDRLRRQLRRQESAVALADALRALLEDNQ